MNQLRNLWPLFFMIDWERKTTFANVFTDTCLAVNDKGVMHLIDGKGDFHPVKTVKDTVFCGVIVMDHRPSLDDVKTKAGKFYLTNKTEIDALTERAKKGKTMPLHTTAEKKKRKSKIKSVKTKKVSTGKVTKITKNKTRTRRKKTATTSATA